MTKSAAAFFDRAYRRFGAAAERRYPNEELCRFLSRRYGLATKRPRPLRALEIGCGSGGNLWMLVQEGFETHGVDSSAKALSICASVLKERWGVAATLRRGTFTRLPYPNASFDCVVDVVSLQHQTLADHAKALREVRRVLKPGGRFFSYHLAQDSFPFWHGGGRLLDEFTVNGVKNPKSPFAGAGLTCFISAGAYHKLIEDAGLRGVVIEQTAKTYAGRSQTVTYLAVEARR